MRINHTIICIDCRFDCRIHLLHCKIEGIMNTLQDRIRGSLIGGAIGDALGYPVEFTNISEIQYRYGERGITRLDTKRYRSRGLDQADKAVVSDDTQMTLFTANGILNAKTNAIPLKDGICEAYVEWYLTQMLDWCFTRIELLPRARNYLHDFIGKYLSRHNSRQRQKRVWRSDACCSHTFVCRC